jgi:hypothetical protein
VSGDLGLHTLDDFADEDLSPADHVWLDSLTQERAFDFAVCQGYDLKDSGGRGRPGPAIAVPALALSARRHGVEKLFKSGDRFRPQILRFSLGGIRLVAQPQIGSPMHTARSARKIAAARLPIRCGSLSTPQRSG